MLSGQIPYHLNNQLVIVLVIFILSNSIYIKFDTITSIDPRAYTWCKQKTYSNKGGPLCFFDVEKGAPLVHV